MEIEIRKPTRGGYGTSSNFHQGHTPYVTAENLAKRYREIWVDGNEVGDMEYDKDGGYWWVSIDDFDPIDIIQFELKSGLRSPDRAIEEIRDHIEDELQRRPG